MRRGARSRHGSIVWLAALGPEDDPVAVTAEIGRPGLADRRIVGHGRIVEHAPSSLGKDTDRRIGRRTGDVQRRPRPIVAAVLAASLAARRAVRIGHASELAVRGWSPGAGTRDVVSVYLQTYPKKFEYLETEQRFNNEPIHFRIVVEAVNRRRVRVLLLNRVSYPTHIVH